MSCTLGFDTAFDYKISYMAHSLVNLLIIIFAVGDEFTMLWRQEEIVMLALILEMLKES